MSRMPGFHSPAISSRLERAHPGWLLLWCSFAAFSTYFCMYAFRKPFTVAKYDDLVFWGINYKIILLFSQVGGYALSKFIGIKIISEMPAQRRALMILGLIGIAHLALLPYAFAPYWLKPLFLFGNGLPLGMVYGCVFAYLEGRRLTEALAAGLCASFIMASGTVKSVGAFLMADYGVSQFWMPFTTGALFWPWLIVAVWMLQQIPPPSALDIAARSPRTPFNAAERRALFTKYWLGLTALLSIMVLMTIFRSIRDDYAAEIWAGFGVNKPSVFARSETLVAAAVIGLSGLAVFLRNNYRAFMVAMILTGLGFAAALTTTLAYWNTTQWTEAAAFQFMVLIGISLYVPYVLFHTTIYERITAMLRHKGNVGFLLYLGDFAGYLATVVLMVLFNLVFGTELDFVGLLFWLAILISPLSIVATVIVAVYFKDHHPAEQPEIPLTASAADSNASAESTGVTT